MHGHDEGEPITAVKIDSVESQAAIQVNRKIRGHGKGTCALLIALTVSLKTPCRLSDEI
jgi:hypothetical protein